MFMPSGNQFGCAPITCNGSVAEVVAVLSELHVLLIRNVTVTPQLKEIIKIQLVWHCMGNHKNVPILQYPGFKSLMTHYSHSRPAELLSLSNKMY